MSGEATLVHGFLILLVILFLVLAVMVMMLPTSRDCPDK